MDGQTRRWFEHQNRSKKERSDMAFLSNQPSVAREFRRRNIEKETTSESRMRVILQSIDGIRFVEQKPFKKNKLSKKFYIVDFYIFQPCRIAIEVDGGYHKDRTEYDSHRDDIISKTGIRVMRFDNDEVNLRPGMVKAKIEIAVVSLKHTQKLRRQYV